MQNELLANIVAVLHGLIIVTVFVGIFVSVKFKRFRPIESFILLIAVVIWSLYDGCPLTYLENSLRGNSLENSLLLSEGFIAYYLKLYLNLNVSASFIALITYIISGFFLILSIDWLIPFFHLKRVVGKYKKKV